ncbi:MAG TPA: CHRD domain-containing protein [Candidatus Binatia bacterium]|nr:CHRD domain-containing protein [Candidatus Binatia bacterium]
MKKLGICIGLIGVVLLVFSVRSYAAAAGGKTVVHSDELTGYQEVTPAGVSSLGTGSFSATIDENTSMISFQLTYTGLSAAATVAHIHFGSRFTSGGVSAFLCGGTMKPACPPGTATEAVVTGTIIPSDVVGPEGQGIAPGEFAEFVRAIRAGMTYVNVHNANFPSGEIRGQINDDNQRQP